MAGALTCQFKNPTPIDNHNPYSAWPDLNFLSTSSTKYLLGYPGEALSIPN